MDSSKIVNKMMKKNKETDLNMFWDELSVLGKKHEKSLDKEFRRNLGIYYTDLELAEYMVKSMFNEFKIDKKTLKTKKILEPSVGVGNFIFSFLKVIHDLEWYSKEEVQLILNNLYFADADVETIEIFKKLLIKFVKQYFDLEINEEFFEERVGAALIYDINKNSEYKSLNSYFPEIVASGGFDIVMTNPPYKNLKADSNKYLSITNIEELKLRYEKIVKDAKNRFKYSNEGTLNFYKLFIEEIMTAYIKSDGIILLLVPSTVLSDKTCKQLRSFILDEYDLREVNIINEKNRYIDANQALTTLLLKRGERTKCVKVVNNFEVNKKIECNFMEYDILKNSLTGNAIFGLDKSSVNKLRCLREFKTIKELKYIKNLRGELDVTNNKKCIEDQNEDVYSQHKYKLLRGRGIGYYKINEKKINEYVNEEFIKTSKKGIYANSPRIVCQQIANINKERRLTFTYIDSQKFVIANSCNFLCLDENTDGIDIYNLLGIMNSDLMNWYFKIFSSNNHINNYEIDALPIPVNAVELKAISTKVKAVLSDYKDSLLEDINKLVNQAFGIDMIGELDEKVALILNQKLFNELLIDLNSLFGENKLDSTSLKLIILGKQSIDEYILENKIDVEDHELINIIISKYSDLANNKILNHTTFKLSDLDLEMIKTIPQGGNWSNIRPEVIAKSQRLTTISKTGGRTTLYGRIDYKKPCYTITTYFNRPGNGTYVHPDFERVLSVREAARIQSFKDNYKFLGNKSQILKQVGNAVPPILGYEIGKRLVDIAKCKNSVDLFVGAGGLSIGFKEAGIKCIVANDFEKMACKTFKVNNPEIKVIEGDITCEDIKKRIYDSIDSEVDIVCGGPPCQGFSHAGKRFIDDPRNELFKDFVEIVKNLKPKVVVIENVEGMVTFNKGAIYNEIIELYNGLGYKVLGRVLIASNYGVPQKRKRVIIICVRNDLNIKPESLFPVEKTIEEHKKITAKDAIYDLSFSECGEISYYSEAFNELSNYAKVMRRIDDIAAMDYLESIEEVAITSMEKTEEEKDDNMVQLSFL